MRNNNAGTGRITCAVLLLALTAGLSGCGLYFIRPQANFVLLKLPEKGPSAGEFFRRALDKNMMIRDCSDYRGLEKGYIRFCFMKKEDDDRLLSLLKETYA